MENNLLFFWLAISNYMLTRLVFIKENSFKILLIQNTVNSCLIRDMSVAQKNVNVYTTKSYLKTSKMDYSVFCPTPTPRHFLLFKIENTEQDLKFPLMTQGYHYGKQFQNDVISQGLRRWVELPVPAEWSRTIALFEIFKLVTYHLPCYCLMLFYLCQCTCFFS